MYTRAQVLAAVAALGATTVNAAMGPAFSTGPVASNSWIREATSTLVLPNGPSGGSTDAITSLWVGMGTSNGDLIQSIADNWQQKDWTMYAYTLMKTGDYSQMPIYGDGQEDGTKGDKVTMHYKFDDASGNYTQTVQINGKTISTLSTSDGHAQGWGSAVECAENNCGTVGAHSWINTKIILDVADPNYINTMAKGSGVTGEMTTTDGGKTWTVSTISIPEFSFGN
ncbi:hypothetical protein BO86DRAFT_383170 [Aspergillus japonicus CBS 114.51]|uniref:Concanavalin A-like lectin/glucanase n=2 Tax=Aspergillus subgen. Circumdati TaxID=2720871 RepID=A0A2V5HUU6_9EURO|nr:hypothetical protein BO86DRAFT_383170 [Aspergillus japonicus CBS 114.51]PYI25864.1 hypothetical protein BP00DRAFT_408582 [Aspergillus indologenus CBS 114.80]RAH77186.1 hypothetical protein BO86DRAFT_383170 [Aspergillus japonicus CBS 114.51]